MLKFIGRLSTQLSVDPKGRVVVPQRVRDQFDARSGETEVMVGSFLAPCVTLYSAEQYEAQVRAMEAELLDDEASLRKKRKFYGSFTNVTIDKAGRISIPMHFLERAGISKEVIVIGMQDRVEFWDPTRYEADADQGGDKDAAETMEAIGRGRRKLAAQDRRENA